MPRIIDGVKTVVVHTDLRQHDAMAWDFVMNFAKDNDLRVTEASVGTAEKKAE